MNPSKPTDNPLIDSLLKQFDISWQLLSYHLNNLTTKECLWQPANKGLFVTKSDNNIWIADFPESESYDIGPPNIAWITWHIDYWWSMVLNHSFGDSSLNKDSVTWKGSADEVQKRLEHLKEEWLTAISNMSDTDITTTEYSRWPISDCPFSDIIAWLNVELMKNAAELGYARFLYANRNDLYSKP